MTRCAAFYAPMKPPTHHVPSGDREIARGLMKALDWPGFKADLVSELRIYDKSGDQAVQQDLYVKAQAEIARLVSLGRSSGWSVWVTYHNYYKAPDLIGQEVSRSLGIPYIVIEASKANKRLGGPWDGFEKAAQAAIDQADVLFYFTKRDAQALKAGLEPGQQLLPLKPFLAIETLPVRSTGSGPYLVTVAMMREGDKFQSFANLAKALSWLDDLDWNLKLIGDGPMRAKVEALFAPFGARVQFCGALDRDGVTRELTQASIFVWPGVGEAFGMSYLEAQAVGLPAIAEDRPGVQEVVHPQGLVPLNDPASYAERLRQFLSAPEMLKNAQETARDFVQASHLLPAARTTLSSAIIPLIAGAA